MVYGMGTEYLLTRPDGTRLSVEQTARVLVNKILTDPAGCYDLTVGTDSQNFDNTRMVEVVALHKRGSGGIFFYHVDHVRRIDNLRVKIYEETQRSLALAGRLTDALRGVLAETCVNDRMLDVHMAIHCDVGRNGATKVLVQEIAGWVEAQGYTCLVKPDSYAASGVANRLSK